MRVLVAGGSGHIGAALRRLLEPEGWTFTNLSRTPREGELQWDGKTIGPWTDALEGADVLLNLAGRTVNCRYTAANLREMMTSRTDSTRVLGQAVAAASDPPKVWLQSSTATIYAHRMDAANDEATGILGGDEPNAPPKWNASIRIAKAWEAELDRANTPRTRKVALRSSMVMSSEPGSVFDVFASLARVGLGGSAGSGRQFVSWIHERDFARGLEFIVAKEDLAGEVNVCSPNPLPNAEFMRVLRESIGVRFATPLPVPVLELGALLRSTETELILKSRRVVPGRLISAGFEFEFPDWPSAAADLANSLKLRSSRGHEVGSRRAG